MYDIQILWAVNSKIKGPDGEFMNDDNGRFLKEVVVKKEDHIDLGRGSTPLSRRILTKHPTHSPTEPFSSSNTKCIVRADRDTEC
jgi:hypothetical protein